MGRKPPAGQPEIVGENAVRQSEWLVKVHVDHPEVIHLARLTSTLPPKAFSYRAHLDLTCLGTWVLVYYKSRLPSITYLGI